MRRFNLLGAAITTTFLAVPAMAADMRMPVKAPPPAPAVAVYNWTGFYIGAHGGGGWGEKCFTFAGTNDGCHDVDGWLAGGQVGFNYQTGNIVLGIEFSGSAADLDGSHTSILGDPDTLSTKVSSIFLLTGRIGLTWDRVLAYVAGGGAWVRDKYTYTEVGILGGIFTSTAKETRGGWTVGAGLEYAFTPNWSLAAQYNYIELGDRTLTFTGDVGTFQYNIDQHLHLATVRLNYRFGAAAPVVARY